MILYGPERKNISDNKPKQLIIILHGYGANGENLIDLADDFAEVAPDAYFLAPNAPFKCEINEDFEYSDSYQWFSLKERSDEFLSQGSKQALPILNEYIDQQLKRFELTSDKLFLVGFSQGTMMSLYTAPRRSEKIAGVVGFSGLLTGSSDFEKDVKSKPDILLIHGNDDNVVDYRLSLNSERILKQNNFNVASLIIDGLGHSINSLGIEKAQDFIKERI